MRFDVPHSLGMRASGARGCKARGPSFGQLLDENKGVGPSFGALRLAAAVAVLIAHAPWLTTDHYDPTYWLSGRQTFLGSLAVAVFFIMSGFLVTQSYLRSKSVVEYAAKRALRILPALVVVVLVSAFVIGPILTNTDLRTYFIHQDFRSYFLNVGMMTRYRLPGVFSDNIYPMVNGSLWTLHYEAICYVLVAVGGLIGLFFRKWLLLFVGVCLVLAGGLAVGESREILDMQLTLPFGALSSVPVTTTMRLLAYFGVGMLAYIWRSSIPLDLRLIYVAVAGCIIGLLFGLHDLLFPVCGGYLVLAIGMTGLLDFRWLRGRDYSYGVYIWSFPIQQGLIATVPLAAVWWGNILLSTPIVFAVALLSWNLVEKPALSLKSYLRREGWARPREFLGACMRTYQPEANSDKGYGRSRAGQPRF